MCAKEFTLTVVTPDSCFLKDLPVTMVRAYGSEGCFAAMAGHTPFLTDLLPNAVTYWESANSDPVDISVSGGFIEVLPTGVTILADAAERSEEIDEERAKRKLRQSQESLERSKKMLAGLTASLKAGKQIELTPEQQARIEQEKLEIAKEEASVKKALSRVKIARNRGKYPRKH